MDELGFLTTFVGGLGGALILGYLAQRLKLSPIIGYLLAGIVVGPFTPGFVANHEIAQQFAEIGVILLLFGIGLRFHLRDMLAVWRIAVPGAILQSCLSTFVLALLLRLLSWSWVSGIILGLAISVASTVVMSLVLGSRGDLHSRIGHIAMGWTVVEDLLTVVMLLLLPIVFGPGPVGPGPVGPAAARPSASASLGLAGLKVVGLICVVVVLGRWVIPWALGQIAKTRSRELFTLAVFVLALGIAVGSARLVRGVHGARGVSGGSGRRTVRLRRPGRGDAVPMRDAFAVLFFVSVGMLFDPRTLIQAPIVVVVVLAVVILGKPLSALLTVRVLGTPLATAIPVGAAFAQVGEFSFILGTAARGLGLIDDVGWNALVAAAILSIALNPTVYRWARGLGAACSGAVRSGTLSASARSAIGAPPRWTPNGPSWWATARSGGPCTVCCWSRARRSPWWTSTSTRSAGSAPKGRPRSTGTSRGLPRWKRRAWRPPRA